VEEKQPNEFGKSMREWWDSDACKELQKANQEAKATGSRKVFYAFRRR
jgi:hypothetical protein